MDIRNELKQELDTIREEFPSVAQKVWELFKYLKTPEKVKETVVVKDDKKIKELDEELQRTKNQLAQKTFQVKQLEDEIEAIKKEWEDRFTVHVEDVQIENPYFSIKDDELFKMHHRLVEELASRLPIQGVEQLSFAKKQMLLHIGFSEYWLLKSLTCRSLKDLEKASFPIRVVVKKTEGEK